MPLIEMIEVPVVDLFFIDSEIEYEHLQEGIVSQQSDCHLPVNWVYTAAQT
jgi:hypothetical protein